MKQVLECARALGEAIVASDAYQRMQENEKRAMNDPAVAGAMNRYLELKQTIEDAMNADSPDAELIARCGQEMDDVQTAMNDMPAIDALTSSRQEFSRMMTQVNHILEMLIAGDSDQEGGCSGNCAGCAGCH